MANKATHSLTAPCLEPSERRRLQLLVSDYTSCRELIPPLQEDEVLAHADALIELTPDVAPYRSLLAVMVNNAAWSGVVSSIPFDRRILLLPKCFRNAEHCPATVDELGILCQQCGMCALGEMVAEAESLGYQVLISEGTTTVAMLMASGQVEAVIGVACLDSFEKSFPLVMNEAVPALAIPLRSGGCANATIDREWFSDMLRLRNNQVWHGQLNIDEIRNTVSEWFSPDAITALLSPGNDPSLALACDWLARGGKYWRPLIMTCLYRALSGNTIANERVQRLAVGVECFHKASLIHDDIEDEDSERYGRQTLHIEYGTAIALNIGDLLIGLGYQLISQAGADAQTTAKMLEIASQGHIHLCLGQGRELSWRPERGLLTVEETVQIYSQKTSPAFGVALKMGAALAGARDGIYQPLTDFSKALGIAYQIKDDLEDTGGFDCDISSLRPSLPVALIGANERTTVITMLDAIRRGDPKADSDLLALMAQRNTLATAAEMLSSYRSEAFAALRGIHSASGKSLLQRLLNRILGGPVSAYTQVHKEL